MNIIKMPIEIDFTTYVATLIKILRGKSMKRILYLLTAVFMSGCASIIEGTTQEIIVNTIPEGANCSLEREGVSIARINPTPGSATVKKLKHDITIRCNKKGYKETAYLNHSDYAAASLANIITGGVAGWVIDSASGADNKYKSPVDITLTK